jgi:hypothetical protein
LPLKKCKWEVRTWATVATTKRLGTKERKASESAGEGERITVRLLDPLNDIVRRAALYRGDISKTISEVLEGVDLNQVKALDLDVAGGLTRATTIVIEGRAFSRLKQASKSRGASMNLLINSALAHKFGYPPKEKSKP